MKILVKILLFSAALVISSCAKKQNQSTFNSFEKANNTTSAVDSIIDVVYSMPDPDEILNEILLETFSLKSDLEHSLDAKDELFDFNIIALHLGVYLSDMTYLLIQEKNQLSIEYFKSIIELSDILNLQFFRNNDLQNKIENNIYDKDALLAVYKETISDIRYELDFSKREKVLALIYIGCFAESLYLGVSNINSENYDDISTRIVEQQLVADNLFKFLSKYDIDSDLDLTIELFDSVNFYMKSSMSTSKGVNAVKDSNNHLHISGEKKQKYNMKDFQILIEKINSLREQVVKN